MNTSITLDNGYKYQSYWGGELRKAFSKPAVGEMGERCSIRRYHTLELITVNGVDWIKSYQDDPNFPNSYHLEYKSMCGNYKIAEYYAGSSVDSGKVFYPFQCSTWRDNMQSTFGNYLNGHRGETFTTFKKAAVMVAAYHKALK